MEEITTNMDAGMKITSEPKHINLSPSIISSVAGSKSNFSAVISVDILPASEGTDFTLSVDVDLPFMIKMMLGSKLDDAINQAADKLAETINDKLNL